MKTGLTKRQKVTEIYFDEQGPIIYIKTHNTSLKNRSLKFSRLYPFYCKLTDDDDQGSLLFEIEKARFCFRMTAPYSNERRRASSEYARKHGCF
ncbi:MAG: hypothetical protein Q8N36_01595 [bacterium]|nr:hypothetical protein [bacterium]